MVTTDDVKRLAALARIEIEEGKLESFAKEFESILAYVGKLETLSLSRMEEVVPPLRNVFREDVNPNAKGEYTARIVAQFPQKEGNALSVKQIISHD